MGETQQIAKHIANLSYDQIPSSNVNDMKVFLLDYLGVALGGVQTESGRIACALSSVSRKRVQDCFQRSLKD